MMTIKAATYSRFSSSNQREESIDAQQRAIYKYMAEKGYTPAGDYTDEALTGTNTDRPGFQRMIEDAKKGLFDIVLVHKMDRFSRNVYDTLDVQNQLLRYGVRIESVIEQFTDTPEGQLQQIIQLGVGQYYSANLAREVMKGLKENAYKAIHNGGIPPLGYDVDPETKKYIINEKEAEAIRIMYQKIIEGWSYRELAQYLNLLGYRTKIGKTFSATSSFYDLLTNPKYKGEYVFNRSVKQSKQVGMKRSHRKNKDESEIIRVPNGLPAIVDEDTFDTVQKILKQRQHSKGQNKAKEVYLLSGLLVCGECGSAYHGSRRVGGRNKQLYVSYRCSKRNHVETRCQCKEINRTLLDQFVLGQLFETLLNEKNFSILHQQIEVKMKEKYQEMNPDLPNLQQRLTGVEKKMSNLVQAIAIGGLGGLESMTQEIKRLEEEKLQLNEMIEKMQLKQESITISEEQLKAVIQEMKEYALTQKSDLMKYILSRFIHQITIYNDAIKIDYNLGGFFVDFKKIILLESQIYRKDRVYNYSSLKEVV